MLQAVWLPLDIRIPHTVEMLADSMVHAGALVVLLVPAQAHAGDALPTAALRPQAHH
jgi:hypothetical protein